METWEFSVGHESTAKVELRKQHHDKYLAELDAMAANPELAHPVHAVKLRADEAQ